MHAQHTLAVTVADLDKETTKFDQSPAERVVMPRSGQPNAGCPDTSILTVVKAHRPRLADEALRGDHSPRSMLNLKHRSNESCENTTKRVFCVDKPQSKINDE